MSDRKSRKWAIRFAGSGGFTVPTSFRDLKDMPTPRKWQRWFRPGVVVKGSVFELKNRETGQTKLFLYSGGGIGLQAFGFRASAGISTKFTRFETERAVRFNDFEQYARVHNISVGPYAPASGIVFFDMPLKRSNKWWYGDWIDLSGPVADPGLDISATVGAFKMVPGLSRPSGTGIKASSSTKSPTGSPRIIRTPGMNTEGNVPSAPGPGVIKTPPIKIEGRIPSLGDSGADFGSLRKRGAFDFGSKLDVPGWVGGASSLGLSSGNKSLLLGDSPLWDAGAKLGLAGIRRDTWHSPWRSPSLGLSLRGSGGGPLSNLWNAGSSFSSGSTLGASLAPTRLNASTSLTSGGFGARSSAGFSPALEGLQDRLSRLNRSLEMPMLSGGRSSIAGTLSGVGSYGSGFGAQGFGPNLRLNVPGLGDFGTGPAGVGLARFSSIRVPSMRLRGPTTLALASQGLASPGLAIW